MLTATAGWRYGSSSVEYTSDGGKTWSDVTPPGWTHGSIFGSFFSPGISSVVVAGATPEVFTTHNNGAHWVASPLSASIANGVPISVDYVGQTGWIMLVSNAAGGAQEDAIYRSSDGGATWTQISATTWSTTSPSAIAPGGYKTGLTFASALDGWATMSSCCAQGRADLYMTKDGGVTWREQPLPVAAQFASFISTTLPPTFFNAQDGVLPVVFAPSTGNAQELALYHTADGGMSWTAGAAIPVAPSLSYPLGGTDAILATASPDNAWVWDGTRLRTSHDGGVIWGAWTPGTSPLRGDVVQIDLVSPSTGFALLGGAAAGWNILQTTDGGNTWAPVG